MAAQHPILSAIIVAVLVVLAVLVIRSLFKFFRSAVTRVREAYRREVGKAG
jgi:hypothetical protein